jgi:hypothetical protein
MSADDDNNSTTKLGIGFFVKPDGSRWVYADLLKYGPPHPRIIVSFLDMFRIVQAIAICEDEKYPPPARGRAMLIEFFRDAVSARDGSAWAAIARKHKIPERRGDVVINANGARLGSSANAPIAPSDAELDLEIARRDAAQERHAR